MSCQVFITAVGLYSWYDVGDVTELTLAWIPYYVRIILRSPHNSFTEICKELSWKSAFWYKHIQPRRVQITIKDWRVTGVRNFCVFGRFLTSVKREGGDISSGFPKTVLFSEIVVGIVLKLSAFVGYCAQTSTWIEILLIHRKVSRTPFELILFQIFSWFLLHFRDGSAREINLNVQKLTRRLVFLCTCILNCLLRLTYIFVIISLEKISRASRKTIFKCNSNSFHEGYV